MNLPKTKLPFSIIGTGVYLPKSIFSAEDVDRKLGWDFGTAADKYKVLTRHFAQGDETVSFMGAQALREALSDAGLVVSDLDLIISASTSKEQPIPYVASLIHKHFGEEASSIPCFDVDTTCLSFLSALHIAAHFVAQNTYRRIAIVSSELSSLAINWKQAEVATLLGDGAAAFIIESDPSAERGVLAFGMNTYSEGSEYCQIVAGATKYNIVNPPENDDDYLFSMNGKAAFKLSAEKMPLLLMKLFSEAKLGFHNLDLVVPHQASPLALAHMQSRLEIPDEKFVNHLAKRGNQVAASIPIAYHFAKLEGRIKPGQNILLVGTSAGISLGAMVLRV